MIGTFLFISGPEIMIILLLVVMLFDAKRIPEVARGSQGAGDTHYT